MRSRATVVVQSFGDIEHLAHHMTDLMRKMLQGGGLVCPNPAATDWTPAVDVSEADDHYEVVVELAGVGREDLEVFTERGYLTVRGWRRDPTGPDKVRLHQMEIEEGRFLRRVRLPEDIDEAGIEARLSDGLLRVRIPKAGPLA